MTRPRKAMVAVLGTLAAIVLGGALLLRSGRIHEMVRTRLEAATQRHVIGTFKMGSVSGPLLGGISMNDISLHDDRGRELLRIKSFALRYHTLALPFRSNFSHVRLDGLWIDLPEYQKDRTHFADYLVDLTSRTTQLSGVEARDLTFELGDETVRRVRVEQARLDVRVGRHQQSGAMTIHELRAALEASPRTYALRLTGENRWDEKTPFDLRDLHVTVEGSELSGSAKKSADGVDLNLVSLHLAPEELRALVPTDTPPAAIEGSARLQGPLDRIAAKLNLRPGRGTLRFDGVIDWPRRKISGALQSERLDGRFFPKAPPLVCGGYAHLDLTVEKSAVVGPVEVTRASCVIKNITLDGVRASALLIKGGLAVGYISANVPGGRAQGSASVRYHGATRVELTAQVTEPKKLIELKKGNFPLPSPPRGTALVSAKVSVHAEPHQKPKVKLSRVRFQRHFAWKR
jgi:hypothetical protein